MRNKQKKGFILMLVVALIPLIGVMSAVLTVNSRNLLIQTRQEALELRARAAFASGVAWTYAHRTDGSLSSQGLILTIDEDASCIVKLVSQDATGVVVLITGRSEDQRFSREYQKEVFIAGS